MHPGGGGMVQAIPPRTAAAETGTRGDHAPTQVKKIFPK